MIASSTRFKLNNGHSIPAVGIGCWMGNVGEGQHVTQMVRRALDLGYRHIDTACNYGNEESVGEALRTSGIPRNEIFITTKLDSADHGRVSEALDKSLEKLGLEYVDLYLVHWPQAMDPVTGRYMQPDESPTILETWRAMESVLTSGKAKSIGVSNFSVKTLSTLLEHAFVVPAVNQVELHPSLPQHGLLSFCESHGIHLTAYSPVGKNKISSDPIISGISRAHGVSSAQVLLSWGVQRGTSIIPKTQHEERLRENFWLIELTTDEMATLDKFHEKEGMHRSVCGFHSSDLGGSCFGWTYEQLGWNMVKGGIVS